MSAVSASAVGGAVFGAAVTAAIAQASRKTLKGRMNRNMDRLHNKIKQSAQEVAEFDLRLQHAQNQGDVLRMADVRSVYEQDAKEDFLQRIVDFHTGTTGQVVLARNLSDNGFAVNIDSQYRGSCGDATVQDILRRFGDISEDCTIGVRSWGGTRVYPVAFIQILGGDDVAAVERNSLVLAHIEKIRRAKSAASAQEVRRARCLIYLMLTRVWLGPEREGDIEILRSSLQTQSAQRLLRTFRILKYQECAVTNVQGIHDNVELDRHDRMSLEFAYKALDGAPRRFTWL